MISCCCIKLYVVILLILLALIPIVIIVSYKPKLENIQQTEITLHNKIQEYFNKGKI
jgi:hypothetical protein